MARIVRRPKRRTTAAIPEFFSSLTARDWRQIRATAKSLFSSGDFENGTAEETIMSSKGYVNVVANEYDGEAGVEARGFLLTQRFWPRAVKKARRVIRKRTR